MNIFKNKLLLLLFILFPLFSIADDVDLEKFDAPANRVVRRMDFGGDVEDYPAELGFDIASLSPTLSESDTESVVSGDSGGASQIESLGVDDIENTTSLVDGSLSSPEKRKRESADDPEKRARADQIPAAPLTPHSKHGVVVLHSASRHGAGVTLGHVVERVNPLTPSKEFQGLERRFKKADKEVLAARRKVRAQKLSARRHKKREEHAHVISRLPTAHGGVLRGEYAAIQPFLDYAAERQIVAGTALTPLNRATVGEKWRSDIFLGPHFSRVIEFEGNFVVQADALFLPTDRNIKRMKKGRAPLGVDRRPINLHHANQSPRGEIVELSSTLHKKFYGDLHHKKGAESSEVEYAPGDAERLDHRVDRKAFGAWRRQYWKARARVIVSKKALQKKGSTVFAMLAGSQKTETVASAKI